MKGAIVNHRQRRAGFSVDRSGNLTWLGMYAGIIRRFNLTNVNSNFQRKLLVTFESLAK